jgi:uncharacterized membrane protein
MQIEPVSLSHSHPRKYERRNKMELIFTLSNIKNFIITMVVFLAIDMLWLQVISKSFYAKHLGYIMTDQVKIAAAFIFYFIFVIGIIYFVINPALTKESWQYALFAGMFFGLITYATYDLTSLAVIKDWPLIITVVDLIWGTFLSGTTALVSYMLIRLIGY